MGTAACSQTTSWKSRTKKKTVSAIPLVTVQREAGFIVVQKNKLWCKFINSIVCMICKSTFLLLSDFKTFLFSDPFRIKIFVIYVFRVQQHHVLSQGWVQVQQNFISEALGIKSKRHCYFCGLIPMNTVYICDILLHLVIQMGFHQHITIISICI